VAIVNYDYYEDEDKFSGTSIKDEDDFNRCLKVATAYLNRLTFGRIKEVDGSYGQWLNREFVPFSDDELNMLKNGLCALTETVYKLNKAEEQALSGNSDSGNVKSRSSGGESVSYENRSTVYDEALKDASKKNALYRSVLMEWIVPEAFRFNPFFAGSR
jgi:hypothetical protein